MTRNEAEDIIADVEWGHIDPNYINYEESTTALIKLVAEKSLGDLQEQLEDFYDEGDYDSDSVGDIIEAQNNIELFLEKL